MSQMKIYFLLEGKYDEITTSTILFKVFLKECKFFKFIKQIIQRYFFLLFGKSTSSVFSYITF